MNKERQDTIDFTPTWGEWANMYAAFARNGEGKACASLRADLAKMAAAAEALKAVRAELPDALKDKVTRVLRRAGQAGIRQQQDGRMKEAAAVADLLGRGACIVDPEVLPAVQDLCDAIPRILEAWELLADLSTALDNAVLHHGGAMTPGDALRRRHLVERAESFLAGG